MWAGELDYLPISSKCLFAKRGIEIDVVEMELKSEGYLREDECLLEVLKNQSNLYRTPTYEEDMSVDGNYGLMPDDWTEEDYEYFQQCRMGRNP